MSQENVEIVRRLYDEWGQGRFSTSEYFAPDVEYRRMGGQDGLIDEEGGLEAMTAAAMDWIGTFERLSVTAEQFIDAGDTVVVFTRHSGTARTSGVTLEAEFADVLTLRDGLITRLHQYTDRAEALAAAGARE